MQAHKFLFAVLLEQPSVLKDVDVSKTVIQVANVVILAEYYQLLDRLRPVFEKMLTNDPKLDEDIILHPPFYLALAEFLHSRHIYEEAMRHFVGRGNTFLSPLSVGSFTHRTTIHRNKISQETLLLAHKKHTELLAMLSRLLKDLQTLQCLHLHSPLFANYPDSPHWPQPTIRERTRFLARTVWLDWVAANCAGVGEMCEWGGGEWLLEISKSVRSLPLDDVAQPPESITEVRHLYYPRQPPAPRNTSIAFLSGHRIVDRVLRIYGKKRDENLAKRAENLAKRDETLAKREIVYCLHEQVREAAQCISTVTGNSDYPPARMEAEVIGKDGKPRQGERAKWGWYVTHMRFEDWEMPWEKVEEVEEDEDEWWSGEDEGEDKVENEEEWPF